MKERTRASILSRCEGIHFLLPGIFHENPALPYSSHFAYTI